MKTLTNDELNAEVCKWRGITPQFFLMKRGYYYRPDAAGYTTCASEAWRVPEGVADKYTYPHDEPVTKHPAPLPNHITGIEALGHIHEAEKGLTVYERVEYRNQIGVVMTEGSIDRAIPDWWLIHEATAKQHCIALLRVVTPEIFE